MDTQFLDLHEGDRVNVAQVEAAAGQWSLPGGRRCSRPALPQACQRFFGHAVRWLRFVSLLEEPCKAQHAHAGAVAVFAAWMREERGWSEDTIRGCRSTVDRFFDRLDERGVALAAVRIADIDQAVARWHARDCSRITIHDYAQRLRTFFRFAERQGWCTLGLADGIMPSRRTGVPGARQMELLRKSFSSCRCAPSFCMPSIPNRRRRLSRVQGHGKWTRTSCTGGTASTRWPSARSSGAPSARPPRSSSLPSCRSGTNCPTPAPSSTIPRAQWSLITPAR